MATSRKTKGFEFPGYNVSFGDARTVESTAIIRITLPAVLAAQTGTLTTRTDNDTGVATLSTGHGILTGNVCDVYWTEGGVKGVRYGMTATVATNAVTLDGGAGDNLPTQDNPVTVVKQTVADAVLIDGDTVDILGIFYEAPTTTSAVAHIDLQDSGNATIEEIDLVEKSVIGGIDAVYDIAGGETNVFTGNVITHAHASHTSTAAATIVVCVGWSQTP